MERKADVEELRIVHALVVDEQIRAIRAVYDEKLLSHEKLVIEKFVAIYREWKLKDDQLILQAKEYERRLEGLNHEGKRILEAQNKSISVDKFDGQTAQYETTLRLLREEFKKQIETTQHTANVMEKTLDDKIAVLAKQVYIIMGGLVVIEFIIKFLVK